MDLRSKFASFSMEELEKAYSERVDKITHMTKVDNLEELIDEVNVLFDLIEERRDGSK